MKLNFLLVSLVAFLVFSELAKAEKSNKEFTVVGWDRVSDLSWTREIDPYLGDDALVGRQACPSALRFNNSNAKFEPVLLKSLPETHSSGEGEIWEYKFRGGLRWWDGSSIEPTEFKNFISSAISKHINPVDAKLWSVNAVGGDTVRVVWHSPPKKGAFFLSGLAFFRNRQGKFTDFECAGLYRIEDLRKNSLTLKINDGYKADFDTIYLTPTESKEKKTGISFAGPQIGLGKELEDCSNRYDIPAMTVVAWNLKTGKMTDPKRRQAVTTVLPRGEILRSLAGNLGTLAYSPVSRSHPAFNKRNLIRPYSIESAKEQYFEDNRGQTGGPKVPEKLTFGVESLSSNELLLKIISDSLALMGVQSEYFLLNDSLDKNRILDGVIGGVNTPSASRPLFDFFSTINGEFFKQSLGSDGPLMQMLTEYDQMRSKGKFQAQILEKFQNRFYSIEPWSVIIGHQACVKSLGSDKLGKLDFEDPDWFRRIILD